MSELTEQQYLIKLAIDHYNLQFSTSIPYEDVAMFSIPPNVNTDLGYEFYTTWYGDNFRLRLYLVYGANTGLSPYRLEVDNTFEPNRLGDEIFVTLGTMDSYYKDNNVYKFNWIFEDESIINSILLTEDGNPILTEDGSFILIEG